MPLRSLAKFFVFVVIMCLPTTVLTTTAANAAETPTCPEGSVPNGSYCQYSFGVPAGEPLPVATIKEWTTIEDCPNMSSIERRIAELGESWPMCIQCPAGYATSVLGVGDQFACVANAGLYEERHDPMPSPAGGFFVGMEACKHLNVRAHHFDDWGCFVRKSGAEGCPADTNEDDLRNCRYSEPPCPVGSLVIDPQGLNRRCVPDGYVPISDPETCSAAQNLLDPNIQWVNGSETPEAFCGLVKNAARMAGDGFPWYYDEIDGLRPLETSSLGFVEGGLSIVTMTKSAMPVYVKSDAATPTPVPTATPLPLPASDADCAARYPANEYDDGYRYYHDGNCYQNPVPEGGVEQPTTTAPPTPTPTATPVATATSESFEPVAGAQADLKTKSPAEQNNFYGFGSPAEQTNDAPTASQHVNTANPAAADTPAVAAAPTSEEPYPLIAYTGSNPTFAGVGLALIGSGIALLALRRRIQ